MKGSTERRYRVAERIILSDVDLPAPLARGGTAAWRIAQAAESPRVGTPYHTWELDRRAYLTFSRIGRVRVLHARGVATFAIDDKAREIRWHAVRPSLSAPARTMIINHVLPLALGSERLILHASAVRIGREVVGFVGASGRGKSTLAAAMARAGGAVMADDALVLERRAGRLMVIPYGMGARLWPDAARAVLGLDAATALRRLGRQSAKRFVPQEGSGVVFHNRPAPLGRIYVLDVPRARRVTRVDPLTGVDAVLPIVSCAFELDVDRAERIRLTFERVLDVVQRVPVRRLRTVQRFDALDDLVAAVQHDMLQS